MLLAKALLRSSSQLYPLSLLSDQCSCTSLQTKILRHPCKSNSSSMGEASAKAVLPSSNNMVWDHRVTQHIIRRHPVLAALHSSLRCHSKLPKLLLMAIHSNLCLASPSTRKTHLPSLEMATTFRQRSLYSVSPWSNYSRETALLFQWWFISVFKPLIFLDWKFKVSIGCQERPTLSMLSRLSSIVVSAVSFYSIAQYKFSNKFHRCLHGRFPHPRKFSSRCQQRGWSPETILPRTARPSIDHRTLRQPHRSSKYVSLGATSSPFRATQLNSSPF